MKRFIAYMLLAAAVAAAALSCNRQKRQNAAGGESHDTETEVMALFDESTQKIVRHAASYIRVEKVESFRTTGMFAGEVWLRVANTSRYDVTVSEAVATLSYGKSPVATVSTDSAITVPRKSTTVISVPFSTAINNLIAGLGAYQHLKRNDTSNIFIAISARLEAGNRSVAVEQSDIPLTKILDAAGFTAEDISKLLN